MTETLATYLFDHGLNPLTRPLAGRLEPDLLGSDAPFSFYVEAKQYRRAGRKYLIDGMHQVWDMLDQLRGTAVDVAEAFYVVYRRGGPRYTFPDRIQHGERMSKEHPGLDFTRADAVRSLLTRALDQIEGPSAPTKRGGR